MESMAASMLRCSLALTMVLAASTTCDRAQAQAPAPVGETVAPAAWSASELIALSVLLAQRDRLLVDEEARAQLPGRVVSDGCYALGFFARDDGGDVALPTAIGVDDPFVLVALPTGTAADARRAIMVHRDGTVLVCEPTGEPRPDLDATLVVARGSKGRFADVLRQPGTGGGGHFWYWLDQVATKAVVTVVDSKGRPQARVRVFSGPVGPSFTAGGSIALPRSTPVATAVTAADGRARLSGPSCATSRIWLRVGEMDVFPARVRVDAGGESLRFVLADDALVTKALAANEAAAVATLKNLSSAQAQCQACGVIDGNRNGAGEYGFFGELSGARPLRIDAKGVVGGARMTPPVMSAAYGNVENSRVRRSGYLFQLFLPAADGSAVAEAPTGGASGVAVDPARAEVLWCAYAWPADPTSGLRTFFVNHAGDVLATDAAPYVGTDKVPAPTAAFAGGTKGHLDDPVAAQRAGVDGNTWTVVN